MDTFPNKCDVITFTVNVKCGSVNEPVENSGSAHFLEHLMFKGTPNRSKNTIYTSLEDIGALLNAYTTREYTSYILEVPK